MVENCILANRITPFESCRDYVDEPGYQYDSKSTANIYSLYIEVSDQRHSIIRQLKCGIINDVDAVKELQLIESKERKLRKELALGVHITNEGKKRTIKYIESKGLWYTMLPDKSKIYSKTEDGLYQKLIKAYGLHICDMSIQGVFEAALEEKAKTSNNDKKTIIRYKTDYNRFISEALSKKNIRCVSKADLKAYTQDMVNNQHPKTKAFLAYKGVLNLIFNYAIEYDIIQNNPVKAINNSVYLKSCDTRVPVSEDKILSEEEIQCVKTAVYNRMNFKRYHGYFINGYAILFSMETGCRTAEICALKWSDVYDDYIHIHAQQLHHTHKGGREYYYADWTKDEKGISRGGRKFPITDAIQAILDELWAIQNHMDIQADYIFCHKDGEWIKTDAYDTCLRRLMCSLDMPVTNNHAFRMSLNSNVFIARCNLPVTERARLLGHSVETNLKYYSYAGKNNMEDIRAVLNGQVSPGSHQKVIPFRKKKSPEPTKFKAFESNL